MKYKELENAVNKIFRRGLVIRLAGKLIKRGGDEIGT